MKRIKTKILSTKILSKFQPVDVFVILSSAVVSVASVIVSH